MAMTSKQYAADSNSNEMHSTPQKKASSQSNLNLSLNSNNEKSKRQKSKEADWVEKYNDDDVEVDVEDEDDEIDKNSDDSIPRPSRDQNKEEYHMRNTHNYVDQNHVNNENHASKTTNSALQKGKKPPTNPFSGKDHIFF